MNTRWNLWSRRAIARGIQILALAVCLVAGGSLGRPIAHASPAPSLPLLPFCATHHYLVSASAHNSVLAVKGACLPYPSSVHIAIRDLTTGSVLRNWITIPVTPFALPRNEGGGFQYVTQGDARPGDAIRFWIVDGAWHKVLTVADTP
jgi:hypothetical protein